MPASPSIWSMGRKQEAGIKPLGVKEILVQELTRRPWKLKKSPARSSMPRPRRCAVSSGEAYAWFVAAYRDAAEKLRAGDRDPPFPAGCFPPALPFVSA
jgi:hypothetical protein